MSNLVVKIKFGEDNRRVTLGANPTFSQLVELLSQLFPSYPSGSLAIKYLDDDEDMVTISSDLELKEAIGIPSTQSAQVLRLLVSPKLTTPFVPEPTTQVPPSPTPEPTPIPSPASSQSTQSSSPFSFPQFPFGNGNPFGMLNNLNLPNLSSLQGSTLGALQPLITQALANPQVLTLLPQILPLLHQFAGQLNGATNSNASGNNNNPTKPLTDMANELTALFKNLGVNQQPNSPSQTPSSTPLQQVPQQMVQQTQQILQQILADPSISQFLQGFGVPPSTSTPSTSSQPTSEQHFGVVCDGCQGSIFGVRFKCSVCPDYDLCTKCEEKKVHDESHPLLKINKPLRYGAGRGCPYSRPGHGNQGWRNSWHYNSGATQNNNNATPNASTQTPAKPNSHPGKFLARFVTDVTIPDGTPLSPNEQFFKVWKLRNEGQAAWPQGTMLGHVGGDKLALADCVTVEATLPGEEREVTVDMVTPSKPGRYVSYWRLIHPDGSRFGQRVWVDIIVSPKNEIQLVETQPTPTPTQSEAPVQNTVMQVESEEPDSPQMKLLIEMGFNDKVAIKAALEKNSNDILKSVHDLCSK